MVLMAGVEERPPEQRWHIPKHSGPAGKVQHCVACARPIPRGHEARAGQIKLGNICQRCLRRETMPDGSVVLSARNGPTIRLGGPRLEEWPIPLHIWSLWHRPAASESAGVRELGLTYRQARVAELRERGVVSAPPQIPGPA